MADTTTVEDWKQAAANLEAQISALEKQQRELEEAFIQQNATTAALRKQRNDLGGANRNSPEGIALGRQIDESNLKAQQIQNQVKQLSIQIVNLDAELQKAERQAGIAQTATPNTKKNTPPANPDPGPNTAAEPVSPSVPTESVPKTVSEPQQEAFLEANQEPARVIEEPPTDEFEGVDLAVATQENALKEPPVLSDEEIEQYLSETETPKYESPPEIDTSQDAAENAKFARQQSEANATKSENPGSKGSARGLTGATKRTRQQATAQDNANYNLLKDWRVRLSLAKNANYLYNADPPGILAPLRQTDGVIFPYTPTITVNYNASYDPTELIHSNYKVYQYRSSSVDSISIVADFTAQDTYEANYVLSVIHFFRSITKMFYGQDNNPKNGTPPPLCYLFGYGAFGFDKHPLVITNFTSTFPNDVDYIRATTHESTKAGVNSSAINIPYNSISSQQARMEGSKIMPGAAPLPVQYNTAKLSSNNTGGTVDATYVPTKLQIQVQASPIISRNDISRRFSLKDYATGKLLRGSKQPTGGGMW